MLGVAVGAMLDVLLAAGASAHAPVQPDTRPSIAHGSDPAQRLDLCVPAATMPGRPAVVMIHSG